LAQKTKKGECAMIELSINVPEIREFIKEIIEVPGRIFEIILGGVGRN
jgi:hypothetical protein